MASAVSGVVRVAHRAGLPLRLTEMNSVTCSGRRGVSDSFATALWAPDALFELLRAGVDGVNVHLRADAVNAAFILQRHGLRARPLLYGLIMFARMLGPGAQLVPLRLSAPGAPHLKAWAVRTRSALHVLLIDKGTRSASVALHDCRNGSGERAAPDRTIGELTDRCHARRPATRCRRALARTA